MNVWHNIYTRIITFENIFLAWNEFAKGKRKKIDVMIFDRFLEENLFDLYESLKNKTYKHGGYQEFYVRDPKIRDIHKACVKDRVVHHLVSKILEEIFEPTFFAHSYSCRKNKGTHKAIKAFVKLARQASHNNSSNLFILKCDIRKFFASIDHKVLINLLSKKVADPEFIWLLNVIIESFNSKDQIGKGMPIGNLTSQLFANIYMDPLDKFIKKNLNVKYYIRYADDFVLMSHNKEILIELLEKIRIFLENDLKLFLYPGKIEIRNYYLGIDFLGYVIFPKFIIPRTSTKRRIFRKLRKKAKLIKEGKNDFDTLNQSVQSYLGYLSHCNSYKLAQEVKNQLLFLKPD